MILEAISVAAAAALGYAAGRKNPRTIFKHTPPVPETPPAPENQAKPSRRVPDARAAWNRHNHWKSR